MSSRRNARERVMQALYAMELGGGDVEWVLQTILRPSYADDPDGLRFAESLLRCTVDRRNDAEDVIRLHTKNWELSRIALIDRIILRAAICELLAFEDIPPKVTINEAIEVAKKYSTVNSSKFVNGILDSVVAQLLDGGRLQKSGRGLVGIETIAGAEAYATTQDTPKDASE